ncbi:MAG TPA: GNAT family N-acetyltransferase [Thermomicrobiales bacterium]|nr:GNAT family N-acetyltransferase [Thermomicrobiales bacterium]
MMAEPRVESVESLLGDHPLDNVIWSALTSRQRHLAEGNAEDGALRYQREFAPFAALHDTSPQSFAALDRMLASESPASLVPLFTTIPITPPESCTNLAVALRSPIHQMVATTMPDVSLPTIGEIVTLGADDIPEMLALVDLTKPGPFAARTHEMGTYLGIRVNGQLAAMTGERFHLDGFTEVSAVCTHPDHRGKGYGALLVATIANGILSRGEIPFLHVFATNTPAIGLYEKMGFAIRRTLELTVLGGDHAS